MFGQRAATGAALVGARFCGGLVLLVVSGFARRDGLLDILKLLIPEEAAPQFLDDAAPRNGMMPPPDSEMISPPITE